MKKLLLCLLLMFTLFTPITQVKAIGENSIGKITHQKTPTDLSQATDVKSIDAGYGGDPILFGDYLYAVKTGWGAIMPELLQIDKQTMKIVKSVKTIAQAGGYSPFITAGDGQIFVPLCDGRIQAFDAKTLQSTWISESIQSENITSRLTYYNGYLYYGIGGFSANQNDPFVCISTKDEDKTKQDETKKITWSYNSGAGYYWSEAVIIEDSIAFVGYDGQLVLHDLESQQVYDTVDLGIGAITNSLAYDAQSHKLVAANKEGYVVSIDVIGHNLKESTLKKSQKFAGQFSSSPIVYNGRVYIGGGAAVSFTVLNLNTLEAIYTNDKIAGQCIPVLSTAYATEENNQEVQLYMINYNYDSSKQTHLYHISDHAKNTSPIYQPLYTLDQTISANYWNGSLIMDEQAFYSYNGNGVIVRFGFDTSIQTEKDQQLIVAKLNQDISGLPSTQNVSVKLDTQLDKLMSTYSRLNQDNKKLVKNINKITELQTIIKQQNNYIQQLNEDIINKLNIYYISQNDEILVNNLISQYQNIHQINKSLIENYEDVIKAEKIIKELKKGIIPKDVFENIFHEDIDYTVSGLSGTLKYTFTFNGQNLVNTNPFIFKVNNSSTYDSLIKKYAPNAFILDFVFEGDFPGKAIFETETTLKDGNYALYYFNEKVNQIEFIQDLVVKNAKTSMPLTHASTYFISEKLDLKNINQQLKKESTIVKTNDQTQMVWPFIGILVAGFALVFVFKQTKKK